MPFKCITLTFSWHCWLWHQLPEHHLLVGTQPEAAAVVQQSSALTAATTALGRP